MLNFGIRESVRSNRAVFSVRNSQIKPEIKFIDTPSSIRKQYQYKTEANMHNLTKAGYTNDFLSIEDGVSKYLDKYFKNSLESL